MRIQDVAKAAGVSVATVSRVLNDPDKVEAKTQARVREAIARLDYAPNTSARSLRTHRSRVLGVALPTLRNPVFAECLTGIADAAANAGYAILPCFTDYDVTQESRVVSQLLASNVEGLILVVSNPGTSPALRHLVEQKRPYVLAYNHHPDHPCITVDGQAAMEQLIAYLTALGHRRIAMVTGRLSVSDRAQQRCAGYRKGMQAAGLAPLPLIEVPFIEPSIVNARASVRHSVQATKQTVQPTTKVCEKEDESATSAGIVSHLLQQANRPTAIIGSNDLIAMRCMRAAQLQGFSVPEDVSIIGFDGIELGVELFPRLATVAQPNEEIGRQCVATVLQAVADQCQLSACASQLLPHVFDPAESCGKPPPLC